ncbi:DMT family transporter [Sphingobacterium sp.]|uniref:DMT family transporter n=1 Tax=Sphingobacterium sp. TaxID=341027 RepID=UPI0028A24E20|nr:DMT family transporter [Sphingobacterium sp.]
MGLDFLTILLAVHPNTCKAIILALIGLYCIVAKDGISLNIGDLWIITCAFAFAFYVLQIGRYADLNNPMPSVILVMTFCAFGCLSCSMIDSNSDFFSSDFDFWKGVLFAAIFATAYMYSIQNFAQRYLSEEKIAMTYLFEPVVATAAGILLLGEPFSKELIIGGSLIIISMLIVELNINPKKKSNQAILLKALTNNYIA